ncbi:MAG: DUF4349 domain-containing protein [Bacteroidetes bacterium]|nr:DUF4349 domain-containing protein [Bacteroidota bacterium]
MKNYLPFILFGMLFFIACNGNSNSDFSGATEAKTAEYYDEAEEQPEAQQVQQEDLPDIPRKVIKTANYRIQVDNLRESINRIERLVESHNGYITSQEESSSNYELDASMTIRVPAEKFDQLLEALGGEAVYTNYKRIEAKDVTEEFIDIQTRLKTKREVRDRYVDILRNKAKTVEEVLLAEEQIRVIQEEIEAKEGRLKYLSNRVSMSTINLNLYEPVEYEIEPSTYKRNFWTDLKESLSNGGKLLRGLFLGIVSIWPLVIILLLLLWKGGWLWRKIRRKK